MIRLSIPRKTKKIVVFCHMSQSLILWSTAIARNSFCGEFYFGFKWLLQAFEVYHLLPLRRFGAIKGFEDKPPVERLREPRF